MPYEILKGREIPPRGGERYPWRRMESGDSIVVDEPYEKGKGSSALSSAQEWLKRNRPSWVATSRRHYLEDGIPTDEVEIWLKEGEDG